jgi:uncharacterized protein
VHTERFEMRLDQGTLDRIDAWRGGQGDLPSRAEAIRRLVDGGLNAGSSREVRISDAQKLILFMLCDLLKGLKVKTDFDPKFIEDALLGGHHWALRWQYAGVFESEANDETVLSEVVDILEMWSFLEDSYNRLSPVDKDKIKVEAEPFGDDVQFPGFDGNDETTHYAIARFLVEKMDRFTSSFGGRDLNSHWPGLDAYRRMLSAFLPVRSTLTGGRLSASQITAILKERAHPSHRRPQRR